MSGLRPAGRRSERVARGVRSGSATGFADRGRTGNAVPREVLRQVRRIELRTRGVVDSLFSGEYHSTFKGQGMEFAEVREYQAGDDVRSIDWNVTARMAHPYIKKHIEERELTVLLAVDLSGSEQFGTRGRFKAELAAEIAAVLALSAVRNNDRVGLLIFTDDVEHVVPPGKGRRHVLRIIRDVLAFRPHRAGTDLAGALDYAGRLLRHRSVLFLLSDFQVMGVEHAARDWAVRAADGGASAGAGNDLARTLRLVSRRHDLVAVTIQDAVEQMLPDVGMLLVTDPETGDYVAVDTGGEVLRTHYRHRVEREREALRHLFRRLAIDEIEVRTDASYVEPLLGFFRRRERKLRR